MQNKLNNCKKDLVNFYKSKTLEINKYICSFHFFIYSDVGLKN